MRFFDLILAIVVLAALLFVARQQFSAYEGKSFVPASATSASPSGPATSPGRTPANPAPAATPVPTSPVLAASPAPAS